MSALDVKSAFLQAPRPTAPGAAPVAVVPPKIMSQLGICPENEVWIVHKAADIAEFLGTTPRRHVQQV